MVARLQAHGASLVLCWDGELCEQRGSRAPPINDYQDSGNPPDRFYSAGFIEDRTLRGRTGRSRNLGPADSRASYASASSRQPDCGRRRTRAGQRHHAGHVLVAHGTHPGVFSFLFANRLGTGSCGYDRRSSLAVSPVSCFDQLLLFRES